jgi:hypothetical protein
LAIEPIFSKPSNTARWTARFGVETYYEVIAAEIAGYAVMDRLRGIRHGKKFSQVLTDGEARPYKKLVGFRTWVDDTE